MFNDAMTRGFTISFRASKASMSPIFAAAHASGGVRASRMAANSCGHDQIFRNSKSECNPGIWKKSALFLWLEEELLGALTSLQLMLRDLAMTWMNRLSLRHSLVPAKSKLTSPRRFWAISCHARKQTYWREPRAREWDTGIKSKPFSLHLSWAHSWPVHRTAWTAQPLGSCPHRLSTQRR